MKAPKVLSMSMVAVLGGSAMAEFAVAAPLCVSVFSTKSSEHIVAELRLLTQNKGDELPPQALESVREFLDKKLSHYDFFQDARQLSDKDYANLMLSLIEITSPRTLRDRAGASMEEMYLFSNLIRAGKNRDADFNDAIVRALLKPGMVNLNDAITLNSIKDVVIANPNDVTLVIDTANYLDKASDWTVKSGVMDLWASLDGIHPEAANQVHRLGSKSDIDGFRGRGHAIELLEKMNQPALVADLIQKSGGNIPKTENAMDKVTTYSHSIQAGWLKVGSLQNSLKDLADVHGVKIEILSRASGLLGRAVEFKVTGPEKKIKNFRESVEEMAD